MTHPTVDCIVYESREALAAEPLPGGVYISAPDPDDNEIFFYYCCPCGCGVVSPIIVGNGFKPSFSPSWKWDGNNIKPTLEPSVNHIGHWHGWLRAGQWVSV